MTGQQLKNSILQMAVQGKLVPQDPNDEPASVLLERIRKEKEQLIKDGKIKKEKNPSIIFRGADNLPYEKVGNNEPVCIADEVPFDIPDTWEWVRLGSIVSVLGGKRIPAGRKLTKENSGHTYIRVSDMKDGYISKDDLHYVPEDIFPNISKYIINKEDVFITVAGTIGRVGKIPPELDGSNLTENADRLVFSLINQDWLIKTLQSDLVQNQIANATTKVGQPKLAIARIENILVALPPILEQYRIVSKVEEILALVDQYEVAYSEVNSLNNSFSDLLKKSILQEAVQGKLVLQDPNDEPASVLLERIRAEKQALIKAGKIKKDKNESVIFRRDNSHYEKLNGIERCIDDEIPFDIPDNWEWCRLYSIAKKDIKRGKSPKYSECGQNLVFSQKCNTKHGTINLLLAKYLDEVTFTKYPTEEYLTNNDIIINSTGHGTLGRVGFFCGNDRISNAIIVPDSHITIIRCFETVTNKYIFYILKFYQPFLEKLGEGSTNQTELKPATIANLLIPIPPPNEQHKIVEKIEALLPFCENL